MQVTWRQVIPDDGGLELRLLVVWFSRRIDRGEGRDLVPIAVRLPGCSLRAMEPAASSQQARTSFDANGWARAYEQYSQAAASGPLTGDDLERFALSASLTGRADDAVAIRTRAHQEFLRQGDAARGARCAFWLAFGFLNTGDMTSGMAWLGRAESLLENVPDCVERGYLRIPAAIQSIDEDPAAAYEEFCEAARIADRFDDNDLRAMASLGSGKALIQLGRPRDATLRLDQAMLAVTANEVSPVLAGDVIAR